MHVVRPSGIANVLVEKSLSDFRGGNAFDIVRCMSEVIGVFRPMCVRPPIRDRDARSNLHLVLVSGR
jgi:hypothetical protein